MVHLQNSTLAGGVAMGVAGDMSLGVQGCIAGGFVAGTVSCFGYTYLIPILEKCNIHDTCGVNNLHGMPGVLGAIISIIAMSNYHGEPNPLDHKEMEEALKSGHRSTMIEMILNSSTDIIDIVVDDDLLLLISKIICN